MIQSLTMHCQHAPVPMDSSINGNPPQLIPPGAPEEAHRVRESVLASISRLSIMLAGPTDFLQQMASQVYILRAPKRTRLADCIITDPNTRLHTMAGRVSDPSLYPPGLQCLHERHSRPRRRLRDPTLSHCPNGDPYRFFAGASAGLYSAHRVVSVVCHGTSLPR